MVSRVGLGVLFVGVAIVGALGLLVDFDRTASSGRVSTRDVARWSAEADERWTLPVSAVHLVRRGQVHAVVCPAGRTDPRARLRVRSDDGRTFAESAFESDTSRHGRCFEASYRSEREAHATVTLVVRTKPTDVGFSDVEVSSSRRIGPLSAIPIALVVLGLAMLMVAPRASGSVPSTPAEPARSDVPFDIPLANAARSPRTLADGLVGRPAPVGWPFAPALVVAGLLGANIAAIVVAAVLALAWGSTRAVQSGTFLAVATLLQHAILAGTGAWLLGAFASGNRRAVLGIKPVSGPEAARALGLAAVLIVVAIVTTLRLDDAADTPIGRLIELVPARYAIVFAAILAPVSEELFFRGAFIASLSRYRPWVGVLASTVVFTGMHAAQLTGARLGLVPIASVALVNGYLRVHTQSVTQPWIVHSAYNLALTLPLYFA